VLGSLDEYSSSGERHGPIVTIDLRKQVVDGVDPGLEVCVCPRTSWPFDS
jgi:hypothetical protein